MPAAAYESERSQPAPDSRRPNRLPCRQFTLDVLPCASKQDVPNSHLHHAEPLCDLGRTHPVCRQLADFQHLSLGELGHRTLLAFCVPSSGLSISHVLQVRSGFKVIWIHAHLVVAPVPENRPRRRLPERSDESESVRLHVLFRAGAELAVAVAGGWACPDVAPRLAQSHSAVESLVLVYRGSTYVH